MAVTVTPTEFILVKYDHAEVLALAESIVERVALPAGRDIVVAINEATPLQRITVSSLDPITLDVEGGALEDPKKPRSMSAENTEAALSKALFRVRDRLDGSFADAPSDDKLSHSQIAAWNVYAVGRAGRVGFPVQRKRQQYNFRNRHQFSDAADAVFDRLWEADKLTWSELSAMSASVSA